MEFLSDHLNRKPRKPYRMSEDTNDAIQLIVDERNRQIDKEDYSPEHDDLHDECELGLAAECYVHAARMNMLHPQIEIPHWAAGPGGIWPWEIESWKPSQDPIRNLVKAGALIAAEIERLQRIEEAKA
ncbi:MAG: hypothetical protein AAFX93_19590 [Verrucomicrobiota bacterium]